jgi:GT2 family glycosyltransferase
MEIVKQAPLVSVIIVNYNTTELTRSCIKSVIKFTSIPIEIILIDNDSTDRSIEQLKDEFPGLILILNQKNSGFGAANNLGINRAKANYVFLLNSDTLLLSDAAGRFFKFMEDIEHQHIACCGGSLISPTGVKQISYGNFPSLAEALASLGPGIFYKTYYRKHLSSGVKVYKSQPHRVDYISGADFFVRKSILKEVGVFDEDFFLYFEETELAFRIRNKGYLSFVLPDVHIVHLEGSSHNASQLLEKGSIFAYHRLLFFQKSYGSFTAKLAKSLYFLRKLIYRQ